MFLVDDLVLGALPAGRGAHRVDILNNTFKHVAGNENEEILIRETGEDMIWSPTEQREITK